MKLIFIYKYILKIFNKIQKNVFLIKKQNIILGKKKKIYIYKY